MGVPRLKSLIVLAGVSLLLCLGGAEMALAQDTGAGSAATVTVEEMPAIPGIWWIAPIGAIFALIMAVKFYKEVLAADEGDELMKTIASYVRDGAMAYLWRQYKVVTVVFIAQAGVHAIMAFVLHLHHWIVQVAFLTRAFFSGV